LALLVMLFFFFFFQAEDGIRDLYVTGVQTCALPIWTSVKSRPRRVNVRFHENLVPSGASTPIGRMRTLMRPPPRANPHRARRTRSEERRVGKEWRYEGGRDE